MATHQAGSAVGRRPCAIWVNGFRTSVRLEPEFWSALEDIGLREDLTRSQLLSFIASRRPESPLTSAVRVFVVTYYGELSGCYRELRVPDVENLGTSAEGLAPTGLRISNARRTMALRAPRATSARQLARSKGLGTDEISER